MQSLWKIFAICCFFKLSNAFGGHLIFELPDKEKMCFSEQFTDLVAIIFEYKVIRGGNNDVDVKVTSPNGKVLYKQLKRSSDKISMEASNGEFKFCFSNEFSTFTHKVISFSIQPFDPRSLSEEAGGPQIPTVKVAAEISMDVIHAMMTHVVDFQRRYRLKEALGRHLAEMLNNRTTYWSLFQAVVVLVTGFGQVFVFKTFFTEKRKSTKLETGDQLKK